MSTLGTLFAFGVKRVTQEEFERESRSRFEKAASLDAATAEKRRADEEAWGARRLGLGLGFNGACDESRESEAL
jgi:hypothetical protein